MMDKSTQLIHWRPLPLPICRVPETLVHVRRVTRTKRNVFCYDPKLRKATNYNSPQTEIRQKRNVSLLAIPYLPT